MSNLGPQAQNASFPGLLQVPGGITSSLQVVTDGSGNATGLSLSATAVSVSGLVSSTAQNIYGGTAGALPYQTALSTTAFVTPGTTGQFLKSNGTAAPTFATITASTVGALPTSGGTLTGVLDLSSNLIQNVATPVASTDVATKGYVDSIATGLQPKAAVTCASTTNISSLSGLLTIDGVTVTSGQRVLVKDQSTSANNGIYVASASAWSRSTDADTWSELVGASVFVSSGSLNANTSWVTNIASSGTLGVTPVTFVQFGAASSYTAGTGLTLAGNQFSLTTPVAIAFGGTNSTATPTSGAVAYGNGSAIAYTSAGTTGQLLKSNGSSAPSFVTVTASTVGATASTVIASTDGTSITNAYTRPPSDMFGDFRSVADFAPAGSLSNSSYDWTTAIQNAVNSLGTSGGTVYFPSRTAWYKVSSTITINNINTLIEGANVTIEMMANTTLFNVTQDNVTIQNIKINSNVGAPLTASSYIVDTSTTSANLRLENITASTLGSGFRVRGNYFRITGCQLDGIAANGYGTYINCTGAGDGIGWLTACSFSGTPAVRPKACVFADDGVAIQITSCEFMQCQYALWLQPAVGVVAIGAFMASNTFFDTFDYAGVYFDNSVNPTAEFQRNVITGSWLSNGAATLISGAPNGVGFLTNNNTIIKSLLIDACEFFGDNIGIQIGNDCIIDALNITNCVISGSTGGGTANADISIGSNAEHFVIDGCSAGAFGGYSQSTNGVYINPGCVDFIVSNNDFYNVSINGTSPSTTGYFTFTGNIIASSFVISSNCANYIVTSNKIAGFTDNGSSQVVQNNLIVSGSGKNIGTGYSLPTSVVGSRSLGSTYQNTKNYPMMVSVTATSNAAGSTDFLIVLVGSSSSLVYGVGDAVVVTGPGGIIQTSYGVAVTFLVPPGKYYRVYSATGVFTTAGVSAWVEY